MSVHHGGRGLGHISRVTKPGGDAEPPPPSTSSDFKNGVFLTPDGPVTFGEMFTDFDGGDLAELVPGTGIVVQSNDQGLVEGNLALADPSDYLAGCVIVMTGQFDTDTIGTALISVDVTLVDVPGYNSGWSFSYSALQSSGTPQGSANAVVSDYGDIFDGPDPNPAFPPDGIFKVAARLAPDGLSISCDGDPVFTSGVPLALDGANTLGFTFSTNGISGGAAAITIVNLQVYAVDAYAAEDLPGLSAL